MKKLITLITCAAMIMCLAGCGKTADLCDHPNGRGQTE